MRDRQRRQSFPVVKLARTIPKGPVRNPIRNQSKEELPREWATSAETIPKDARSKIVSIKTTFPLFSFYSLIITYFIIIINDIDDIIRKKVDLNDLATFSGDHCGFLSYGRPDRVGSDHRVLCTGSVVLLYGKDEAVGLYAFRAAHMLRTGGGTMTEPPRQITLDKSRISAVGRSPGAPIRNSR
jgi:hypothetical protein